MGIFIANGIYIVNGKGKYKELIPANYSVLGDDGNYYDFATLNDEGTYDDYMVKL